MSHEKYYWVHILCLQALCAVEIFEGVIKLKVNIIGLCDVSGVFITRQAWTQTQSSGEAYMLEDSHGAGGTTFAQEVWGVLGTTWSQKRHDSIPRDLNWNHISGNS